MKPLLIACDFDGTITTRDTLHVVVETFGRQGLWDELEPRLRSGAITIEQAMQIEFAEVRASQVEITEAVRELAPLRAGVSEFVEWCELRGHQLVLASNGFRSIIEPVLERNGLGHLDLIAHDAVFDAAGCRLIWADRGDICELCSRACKRAPLGERWSGEPLVYIGDGISDRCVCLQADLIFARDGLAEHLEQIGVAFEPFGDFHDILARLSRPVEVAA